jgi:lipopolysaccharide export system protein LptC
MTDGLLAESGEAMDRHLRAIGRQFDIKAAGRHTSQVRFVRRAIWIGVPVFLVLLCLVVFVRPFHLPVSFSLGKVRIDGTRIDVASPRLSGYRSDGTPYAVKASLGTQDLAVPSIIDMQDVDADLGMTDKTTSHVTASTGTYDSSTDGLRLTGAVHMHNTSGYDVQTSSASVDFKSGDVAVDANVHVALTGADISADAMAVTDNGHKVTFLGNVRSTFVSDTNSSASVAQGERP